MKSDLICEDLIQSNLKLMHSHIVSNHLSQRPTNKVFQDQTPSVSPAELLLSRETCRTLAQLRTNKSPLLVSYLFSIGDPRHPSRLCPLCLMHDHTSSHLFECKSLPSSLSSLDLWTNPDKVEPFLATWGGDCWLPHNSGAGLCWQHVGGVGSTTTTKIFFAPGNHSLTKKCCVIMTYPQKTYEEWCTHTGSHTQTYIHIPRVTKLFLLTKNAQC